VRRHRYLNADAWLLTYADLVTNLLVFFVMLLSAAAISNPRMQQIIEGISGSQSPASLGAIKKEVEARIREENLQNLVRARLTAEGLEMSLNSGLVFDSGRADVREGAMVKLDAMLGVLIPHAERYQFAVEGHADPEAVLPGGRFDSNWDLSFARANMVRARLEQMGVPRQRLRVEGYADTRPLPEEALAGLDEAERMSRLRRVVVRAY
jgi:chemotaxis protein MotB